jgi:hypothetical protein
MGARVVAFDVSIERLARAKEFGANMQMMLSLADEVDL